MSNVRLHVSPSHLSAEEDTTRLLTFEPSSLAAIFLLQLTRSGQYDLHLVEDMSSVSHGYLPYCTQDDRVLYSTFESIVAHLGNEMDNGLTEEESAKAVAWKACMQTKLADLTAYMYYGNALNCNTFTHPKLVTGLPFLKRYYLPKRIRESFKRRLESEGMWEEGVHYGDHEKAAKKGLQETREEKVSSGRRKIKHALAQEKVLETARAAFSLFDRLLNTNEGRFIFGDSPTTADLLLAAHILVLAPSSVLPDKQLAQVVEEFPNLLSHAETVQELCMLDRTPRTKACDCSI